MGRRRGPQLEDIPDLFHHIQAFLPVEEAARTSVLSKLWLNAWSTNPNLRFGEAFIFENKEQIVERTLLRYLRDNIPIESLDLAIETENQESASRAESWIRPVATKSCLKQLSLSIKGSFTLPDEILSCRNLNLFKVTTCSSYVNSVCISNNPVMIKCVSLQELHLAQVHISEEVLSNLLSTCTLLKKIHLEGCKGFQIVKVNNLRFLHKLVLISTEQNDSLEIDDVPNLHLFDYVSRGFHRNPLPFNMNSLRSVTHLSLSGVVMDNAFLDKIELKLPFLESLILYMDSWRSESFSITCATLKRLSLCSLSHKLVHVRLCTPKILYFHYNGIRVGCIVFPGVTVGQIEIMQNSKYGSNGRFVSLKIGKH